MGNQQFASASETTDDSTASPMVRKTAAEPRTPKSKSRPIPTQQQRNNNFDDSVFDVNLPGPAMQVYDVGSPLLSSTLSRSSPSSPSSAGGGFLSGNKSAAVQKILQKTSQLKATAVQQLGGNSAAATPKECTTILTLGTGNSGKSTILKQIQLMCTTNGFDGKMRSEWALHIRTRCADTVKRLATVCEGQFESDNKSFGDYMVDQYDPYAAANREWSPSFARQLLCLWNDNHVQSVLKDRAHEAQVSHENALYNFAKFNTIFSMIYSPTDQDIIMNAVKTIGVFNNRYEINPDFAIQIWDTGGQRVERKKWKVVYRDHKIDYVMFVVSLADYNMQMYEDTDDNRMHDALTTFSELLTVEQVKHVPILLIFNQVDLFERKLLQFNDLQTIFPDYDGGCNSDAAKEFLRVQFLSRLTEDTSIHESEVFCYQINAIEMESVRKVLNRVMQDM